MTTRTAALVIGLLWTLGSCQGEPTNPDRELPDWYAAVTGSILMPDGSPPDADAYDPYGYLINVWTEGFGCGDEWEGNSSRRLSEEDGSWVGSVSFPAVVGLFLEDSVCTHVMLRPPPTSPWRPDTISVGPGVAERSAL